jgi:methionyl aminopeptidase
VWGITIRTFFPSSFMREIISCSLLECLLMIHLKSTKEIEIMKGPSRIVAEILLELREIVREGVTTADVDKLAEELTLKKKAKPAFKGYRGFPASLCISVNEQVVHGIPSPKRVLKSGDIVGLDFGVIYDGYYGDSAMTVPIGEVPPEVDRLLKVTEQCLYRAIEQAVPGNYISDISGAVQKLAEANHYGIVREFCGHGIGRSLHEDPPVLNYVQNGKGPKIKPGFVLAIEPMINLGSEKVKILEDGWTVITADGRPSAHFEHTIAITQNGPEILTRI